MNAQSPQRFAALLQEGITAIADHTSKPKGVIRDELGYAIGRKGGSAIEYWAYGDGRIPKQQQEIAALARTLVNAGKLDQEWLTAFLESAGYPNGKNLVVELFPTGANQPSHNLPLATTPFVGRQQELADLADLIANPDCRLITLVGPGGSGKTRLAIEVARNAAATFTNGTAFVTLAPISSANLIVPTIAATLKLILDGHIAPQTQLLRYLHGQKLLLVLDNFEQLLTPPATSAVATGDNAALTLLVDMLQQTPDVTILVTSRERLNLQGEWLYDVGGLAVPAADEGLSATESSAVMLFMQTARRVQRAFTPSEGEQAAILQICQLVDGMPLAIELAAAWVRVLSCSEIIAEIEASLALLTTALNDLPARHRSMRAVFDHSWQLLNAEEQQIFARCSVFRGGFTREAAVGVAGATLPMLAALADKSWISRNQQDRYTIHELARQYGADRLDELQGTASTRNRHLAFFAHLSEEAEPRLRSGPQIVQWYDRIELDHDNLRVALDWALGDGGFEVGFRMVGALWEFWMNRGYVREGQTQAERFLAQPEAEESTHIRAKALHSAASLAYFQGYYQEATFWSTEGIVISRGLGSNGKYLLALFLINQGYTSMGLQNFDAVAARSQESLALGNELGDAWIRGHALLQLGYVAHARCDDLLAQQRFHKSFESFRTDGQSVMRGIPALRLGELLYEQGDYTGACTYFHHSLNIFNEVGDPARSAHICRCLGRLAMAQEQPKEAEVWLTKALDLTTKTGQIHDRANTLDLLGRLAQQRGNSPRAWSFHQESLTIWVGTDREILCIRALEAFACLAARQGEVERAALLFGAVAAVLDAPTAGWELLIVIRDPYLRANHDRLIELTRNALGEAAFAAAWAKGAAMDLQQAIDFALETS